MNFFFTRNTNVMSLGHAHDHVTREEKVYKRVRFSTNQYIVHGWMIFIQVYRVFRKSNFFQDI